MEAWAEVLILFILVGGVVLLVLILSSQRGKGRLELPGRARLTIQFERGWQPLPRRRPAQPATTPRPRFWLEAKGVGRQRWRYPLDDQAQVYLGRRADNHVVLQDPTADTRQAVIYWEDGRYKINNLSARVPTRVNGQPITKQNLGDGNTIRMGRTKLIFREKRRKKSR